MSLDGATAATNDAIRGAGTYERILEGIALLSKQRFPHLSINTVVTRTNFGEIEQLCELARSLRSKNKAVPIPALRRCEAGLAGISPGKCAACLAVGIPERAP